MKIVGLLSPLSLRRTFGRVWLLWKKALRFRKASQHSQCAVCHLLRSEIRHSKTLQEHINKSDQLLRHLADQWRDRETYWSMREAAKQQGGSNTWVGIMDGMDRQKYAIPRWHGGREPKGSERCHRPVLEVSGMILHGAWA
jgi:hypothetical protein